MSGGLKPWSSGQLSPQDRLSLILGVEHALTRSPFEGDVSQDGVFVNVSVDFGIAYSRLHFRELFYNGRAGSLCH